MQWILQQKEKLLSYSCCGKISKVHRGIGKRRKNTSGWELILLKIPFSSSYACHLPFRGWLISDNFIFNHKIPWLVTVFSDCRQSYFIKRKGSGNERVSRMESAVGIHFRRGKQQVSRLLSRWNLSVYSSVWTSRNPDFDLGVDFVDTLKYRDFCHGILGLIIKLILKAFRWRRCHEVTDECVQMGYENRNVIAIWQKFWFSFFKSEQVWTASTVLNFTWLIWKFVLI